MENTKISSLTAKNLIETKCVDISLKKKFLLLLEKRAQFIVTVED